MAARLVPTYFSTTAAGRTKGQGRKKGQTNDREVVVACSQLI